MSKDCSLCTVHMRVFRTEVPSVRLAVVSEIYVLYRKSTVFLQNTATCYLKIRCTPQIQKSLYYTVAKKPLYLRHLFLKMGENISVLYRKSLWTSNFLSSPLLTLRNNATYCPNARHMSQCKSDRIHSFRNAY